MSGTRMAAGVYDHAGWAAVVCIAKDMVVDRRRIDLIEPGLPKLPHHTEGQTLPIADGVALVARVRTSAALSAGRALDTLPASVAAIAIRERPMLPPTVAERIANYRAQCVADTAMYRDVIVEAAKTRGWSVYEYDVKTVFADAANALGFEDIPARMEAIGQSIGPPWNKDYRLAAAAAMVAARAAFPCESTRRIGTRIY